MSASSPLGSSKTALLETTSKTTYTARKYAFAIAIILGGSGLVFTGVGITVLNLYQVHATSLAATGVASILLIVLGEIGYHKNRLVTTSPPPSERVTTTTSPLLIAQGVIGQEVWENEYGITIIDDIPPPPTINWDEIHPLFNKPYKEVCALFYVPKEFYLTQEFSTTFTLNSLNNHEKFRGFDYGHFAQNTIGEITPPEAGFWVLMTLNILPESKNKTFEEQQKMLKSSPEWTLPSVSVVASFIEAVKCITAETPLKGVYTRCREKHQKPLHFVVKGGDLSAVIRSVANRTHEDNIGIAPLKIIVEENLQDKEDM